MAEELLINDGGDREDDIIGDNDDNDDHLTMEILE